MDEEFASLRTCLSAIADPRQRWGRVHSLEGVLSLSVLCLMANGRSLLAGVRVKKAATERVFGFEIMPAPFVVAHLQLRSSMVHAQEPIQRGTDYRDTEGAPGGNLSKGPDALVAKRERIGRLTLCHSPLGISISGFQTTIHCQVAQEESICHGLISWPGIRMVRLIPEPFSCLPRSDLC